MTKEGTNSGADTSSPLAARVRRDISRSVRLEEDEGDRRAEKRSAGGWGEWPVGESLYDAESVDGACQEEAGERSGLHREPMPRRDIAASRSGLCDG